MMLMLELKSVITVKKQRIFIRKFVIQIHTEIISSWIIDFGTLLNKSTNTLIWFGDNSIENRKVYSLWIKTANHY
jgi:hypothetical protein